MEREAPPVAATPPDWATDGSRGYDPVFVSPYQAGEIETDEAPSPSTAAFSALADLPPGSDLSRVRPTPLWKRLMDILVAGTALIVFSPLFAVIAVLIRLTSPGPLFFIQWRSGRGGVPFRMYKFRSMVVDAEAQKSRIIAQNERDGPAFKMRRDPRVTPIGRILRRTNLDELPQLWNVLVGQMSLVGPRPLPCDETAGCEDWQLERLQVNPGLTCFWQAAEHRSAIPFCEWMEMDIQYVRCRSFLIDLKLIVQTVVRISLDALHPRWN